MKSSMEQRAKKFIQSIYPFIKNCEYPEDYRKRVHAYNEITHRHVEVHNGMSRVCLVLSDYCVKIDINRSRTDSYGGCESEYTLYQIAVNEGYDYLFARVEAVEACGRTWYVMERVGNIGLSKYSSTYAYELVSVGEATWLDLHCCDLHNENFGFRNGRIIIVDYAMNYC
jgi:hypothetical protein